MSNYFNYKKMLSYQACFNFIVAERGLGKTYGMLKYGIDQFRKNKSQFIYLRRYNSELERIGSKLFDAHLKNKEFNDDEGLTYKNFTYSINGQPFCYMVPLTREGHMKSVPMPDTKFIIYDEFLITNKSQHYINQEPVQLLSFVDSIFRERDPKIYFLGNASSHSNPYFDYFDIELPYHSDFALFKNNLMLINYAKNQAFRDNRRKSKFGQIIDGTSYGRYAIDNEFLHDDKNFIAKKTPNSWLFACIYINKRNYGLWIDNDNGNMYLSKKFDPNNPRAFCITQADHTEATRLATIRNSPWFKKMILCYKTNQLYFENINIKNYVLKAIRPWL